VPVSEALMGPQPPARPDTKNQPEVRA